MAPELARELKQLLLQAGEELLAAQVDELAIVDRCRCGDDFCATFSTAPRPFGRIDHTIALVPKAGMLNLDIVDTKIVQVEVLYRDDLKAKILAAVP